MDRPNYLYDIKIIKQDKYYWYDKNILKTLLLSIHGLFFDIPQKSMLQTCNTYELYIYI